MLHVAYLYIFTTNNHMHVRDEEILLILQFRLPHVLGCIFKRKGHFYFFAFFKIDTIVQGTRQWLFRLILDSSTLFRARERDRLCSECRVSDVDA